jgi:hypothetical protein
LLSNTVAFTFIVIAEYILEKSYPAFYFYLHFQMVSHADRGMDTHDESHYDLSWGDMPGGLLPWDWHASYSIHYNILASSPEPLISPPYSEYCQNDVMIGSMLNDKDLYSVVLSGSLSSLRGVEEQFHPKSRTERACLYEEAALDSPQDHYGSPSAGIASILSLSPPEADPWLPTGTKTGIKTERKKRPRRKLSDKKNAKGTKAGSSKGKRKRYMQILERNRRAAANCRARKQHQQDTLTAEVEKLQDRHKELSASCNELRETVFQLKLELLRHGNCDCTLIQQYIASEAVNSVENLISKQSPPTVSTIGQPVLLTVPVAVLQDKDWTAITDRENHLTCSHETVASWLF